MPSAILKLMHRHRTTTATTIFGLCATRSLSYRADTIGTTATGLYGFDVLKTAKGFRRFVDDAIERSGELVSYISGMPPSIEVVRAMDEISNTVCCVLDSAELCRQTHPDREFVVEATNATIQMNDYLHFLNTNRSLYKAVKKAESEDMMSLETQRMAHSLRVDFEKGGIHLCEGKMDRVNQLNIEIAELGRKFNENIISDPGYVDIFPASRIPRHVQHLAKPIYGYIPNSSARRHQTKEKGLRIKTDQDTLSSVLRWTPEEEILGRYPTKCSLKYVWPIVLLHFILPEVRRSVYITGNSVPRANLAVLDKLIATRHELAEIMGYKTYAEFAIQQNMAQSPKVVRPFLHDLSEIVRHNADGEFKTISDFKKQMCAEASGMLEPWDETYYTGIMKSSAYDVDPTVVASYFSLSQCIEGLKILVESLFGAQFRSIPLAPGESWHPDVIKLSLCHSEEGDLGYLYLDLCSREGKYPGCAHYAIQGGRQLSETQYQLPVIALVCNFSASRGSSSPVLNHWEVEVLFHEFGHALHSLLSRTVYQHFSGTRTVLDLAETPSNLFEYYAWDYRVLKRFAKHYSTGDVIPEKLVDALNSARCMFSATELQRQIFYSLMDQTLFGEHFSSAQDTIAMIGELRRKHTSWGYVEGTHWYTRFSHLINYGAGYYSYLYARCFAATIWQEVCHEDPLSSTTGSAIRSFMLHGGAKDPVLLLKELAGDSVLRCCNGGVVPNVGSLCKEIEIKHRWKP